MLQLTSTSTSSIGKACRVHVSPPHGWSRAALKGGMRVVSPLHLQVGPHVRKTTIGRPPPHSLRDG